MKDDERSYGEIFLGSLMLLASLVIVGALSYGIYLDGLTFLTRNLVDTSIILFLTISLLIVGTLTIRDNL